MQVRDHPDCDEFCQGVKGKYWSDYPTHTPID